MLVLINGSYRTGSTLVYNIVRLLFELNDIPVRLGFNSEIEVLKRANYPQWYKENYLCKVHHMISPIGAISFFTARSPKDVYASWYWMYKKGEKKDECCVNGEWDSAKAKEFVLECDRVIGNSINSYYIGYDSMVNNIPGTIKKIAELSYLPFTDELIKEITNLVDTKKTKKITDKMVGANSVTELREHHISDTLGQPNSFDLLPKEIQLIWKQ